MAMLFTGDLEAAVLYDLAHDSTLDLRAQWLKVPHHGSRGSLVEEFYQAVDPRLGGDFRRPLTALAIPMRRF